MPKWHRKITSIKSTDNFQLEIVYVKAEITNNNILCFCCVFGCRHLHHTRNKRLPFESMACAKLNVEYLAAKGREKLLKKHIWISMIKFGACTTSYRRTLEIWARGIDTFSLADICQLPNTINFANLFFSVRPNSILASKWRVHERDGERESSAHGIGLGNSESDSRHLKKW